MLLPFVDMRHVRLRIDTAHHAFAHLNDQTHNKESSKIMSFICTSYCSKDGDAEKYLVSVDRTRSSTS